MDSKNYPDGKVGQLRSPLIESPCEGTSFSSFFEIPEVIEWLTVYTEYQQVADFGWFIILVWDPLGKLRLQYMRKDRHQRTSAILDTRSLSGDFGSVSGPLATGRWRLQIIIPPHEEAFSFHFQVSWGRGKPETPGTGPPGRIHWAKPGDNLLPFAYSDFPWHRVLVDRPGWYQGDCHLHTLYSDGSMSIPEVTREVRRLKLDFTIVTDHNFYHTGWDAEDILVIPGIEITSSHGHCNLLGIRHWIDWRPDSSDGGCETQTGINRILQQARQSGALCSLNHPFLVPWNWRYDLTPIDRFDTLEVWNSPNYPDSRTATEKALRLWTLLWNDGWKVWGIGGSDSHAAPADHTPSQKASGSAPTPIGEPANRVFAGALSAQAILEGIRQGRVMVSRRSVIEARMMVNDQSFLPGSDLTPVIDQMTTRKRPVFFRVQALSLPEPSQLLLIQDGQPVVEKPITDRDDISIPLSWPLDRWSWTRLELRDRAKNLICFSNPFYSGRKKCTFRLWKEAIERLG